MSEWLTLGSRFGQLEAFWSHALAALLFGSLIIWQLVAGPRQAGQRLLLGGFALTALWAWLSALGPDDLLAAHAETARNLVWVGMLYHLSGPGEESADGGRQHGVRLVYFTVAIVIGLQFIVDLLPSLSEENATAAVLLTSTLLRITGAAGALVLVHNVYGQAAPASRTGIRLTMIALALTWVYDLNLYTVSYLDSALAGALFQWRGLAVALTAPFFALGARRSEGWRLGLSRAATFQSLSLLAICSYFAVMAILATALRGSGWDWVRSAALFVLAGMTVTLMVVLPSSRARGWAKVKIAKHFFEHRYDYRTEWLRFTATLGATGADAQPLGERVIKAFADIVDSPGGLLLVADDGGTIAAAALWNWDGEFSPIGERSEDREFWRTAEAETRVIEFDAHRSRYGSPRDLALPVPAWLVADLNAWVAVPLIHGDRLTGLVVLAAPPVRRALDWEDFDLLRTAGRQAASSLAEAHGQQALMNAQRFEEFNRRFAFILHDIKNLVSQLSLLTRNAERHAGNAEFQADMVATLKSSVGKMNDLLARLAPAGGGPPAQLSAMPLRPVLSAAIAAKRRGHEVLLLGDAALWAVGDPVQLENAVGHLVQNAIDASPAEEAVTVHVKRRGTDVLIEIVDHGTGMDPEFIRTRLFQPFASTKSNGFGVGAFEARSLVAAMGGQLSVESRVGKGSRFTITLPVAAEAVAPARLRKIA